MLVDRYEADKFFDEILKMTTEIEPILLKIDEVLDDEELYQLIRKDMGKRYKKTTQTGRNSTPGFSGRQKILWPSWATILPRESELNEWTRRPLHG